MDTSFSGSEPHHLVQTLADFRFALRKFLQFSERAALAAGIQTRQHQLLLQVAGAQEGTLVTVAYAAERLGLKHNSTVELVDRSVREGLLAREEDAEDRRRTILRITQKGREVLSQLADQHAREITEMAPRLIQTLEQIRQHATAEAR